MCAAWTGSQVTFEDAWQLWKEVEDATGARLECRVWPPRQGQGGLRVPPMVAITAVRREGKKDCERTANCQIGGARGARTVPAAMVRALTELAARLEAATEERVTQAAF